MENKLTHAGCVVFREGREMKRYLVISSSTGKHWVLPKGHIEKGETSEEAALRELEEEAGFSGEIIQTLSTQTYKKRGEKVIIQYYLVRMSGTGKSTERREIRWERKSSALKLLSFKEARNIFEEAVEVLRRMK